MLNAEDRARFEQIVLPHLDAAFNLAAWILSSRTDAEEVTQDAMLRAFRFFESFNGGDVRAWLLQIVRNTCYTWLEKNRRMKMTDQFDEQLPTTQFRESVARCAMNSARFIGRNASLHPRTFKDKNMTGDCALKRE